MGKCSPETPHLPSNFPCWRRVGGALVLIHEERALAMVWDTERRPRVGRWLFEVVEVGGSGVGGGGGEGLGDAEVGKLKHGDGEEEPEGVTVGFVG